MKDKTRYQNHPLWDNVKGILASEDLGNLPSGTRGYLLHLLHDLDKRRESTNPFYVQERSLDDLNNRLSNVASWISNPNNASSIDQYVDACFATLSSEWPANNGRKVADISKSTYDDFIHEATSKIASAREAADKVEELSRQFKRRRMNTRFSQHFAGGNSPEGNVQVRLGIIDRLVNNKKMASLNTKRPSGMSDGSVILNYPRGGKESFPCESRALIFPSTP